MKQMHESNNLFKGENTMNRLNNKKRVKLIIMQPKASKALSLRKEVRTSEQNSRKMGEFASFSEYLIH